MGDGGSMRRCTKCEPTLKTRPLLLNLRMSVPQWRQGTGLPTLLTPPTRHPLLPSPTWHRNSSLGLCASSAALRDS